MTFNPLFVVFDPYTTYFLKNDGYFWMRKGIRFPTLKFQRDFEADIDVLWRMGHDALTYIPYATESKDFDEASSEFCDLAVTLQERGNKTGTNHNLHVEKQQNTQQFPPIDVMTDAFYGKARRYSDAKKIPPEPELWAEACCTASLLKIQTALILLAMGNRGALTCAIQAKEVLYLAELCVDRFTTAKNARSATARDAAKERQRDNDERKSEAIADWDMNGNSYLVKWKSLSSTARIKCKTFDVTKRTMRRV